MADNINPDHYKSETSLECIEAMMLIFGPSSVIDFCVCNAWKYIWRWKNKNGLEDLDKAEWYIGRANELLTEYTMETSESTQTTRTILIRMTNYINGQKEQHREDFV